MSTIKQQSPTFHAPVDRFRPLRNKALTGELLEDVNAMEDSLLRFGLLSPLTVIRSQGRLIVLDGRKRLAALRRLAFEDRLPDSLGRIAYQIAGQTSVQKIVIAPSSTRSSIRPVLNDTRRLSLTRPAHLRYTTKQRRVPQIPFPANIEYVPDQRHQTNQPVQKYVHAH